MNEHNWSAAFYALLMVLFLVAFSKFGHSEEVDPCTLTLSDISLSSSLDHIDYIYRTAPECSKKMAKIEGFITSEARDRQHELSLEALKAQVLASLLALQSDSIEVTNVLTNLNTNLTTSELYAILKDKNKTTNTLNQSQTMKK